MTVVYVKQANKTKKTKKQKSKKTKKILKKRELKPRKKDSKTVHSVFEVHHIYFSTMKCPKQAVVPIQRTCFCCILFLKASFLWLVFIACFLWKCVSFGFHFMFLFRFVSKITKSKWNHKALFITTLTCFDTRQRWHTHTHTQKQSDRGRIERSPALPPQPLTPNSPNANNNTGVNLARLRGWSIDMEKEITPAPTLQTLQPPKPSNNNNNNNDQNNKNTTNDTQNNHKLHLDLNT